MKISYSKVHDIVYCYVSGHLPPGQPPPPRITTPRIITRQDNYPLGQVPPRTTTPGTITL